MWLTHAQWSEVYDHFQNSLPKETVIHIWKSVTNVSAPLAGERASLDFTKCTAAQVCCVRVLRVLNDAAIRTTYVERRWI